MASESYYSQKVTNHFRTVEGFTPWKIHDQYAGGVPDMFIEGPLRDAWIEAKLIKLPVKPTTVINFCDHNKPYALSALQVKWLTRRWKITEARGKGFDVYLLVYSDEGAWALLGPDEFLEPMTCAELKQRMAPRQTILQRIENALS